MADSSDNYVDLGDGQKVDLPSDFKSTGKIGVADVFASIFGDDMTEMYGTVEKALEEHILQMRMGNWNAIMSTLVAFVVLVFTTSMIVNLIFPVPEEEDSSKDSEEEPIVLRDFTIEQLREFTGGDRDVTETGTTPSTAPKEREPPIFVALKGIVYDVSSARNMYGKGAGYHCFAGRESTRAMAKFSFDEKDLGDPYKEDDFGMFERNTLDEWCMKFEFKYPKVGNVSTPLSGLSLTKSELEFFDGIRNAKDKEIPAELKDSKVVAQIVTSSENRINVPILVAISGKVIDVSYGGMSFYGPGGPYAIFAGRNISRALATMSLKPEDVQASHDGSVDSVQEGLSAEQLKVLKDWETKFVKAKKYPVIGQLVA